MKKLFLILSVFFIGGLFLATPSYATTTVSWSDATQTITVNPDPTDCGMYLDDDNNVNDYYQIIWISSDTNINDAFYTDQVTPLNQSTTLTNGTDFALPGYGTYYVGMSCEHFQGNPSYLDNMQQTMLQPAYQFSYSSIVPTPTPTPTPTPLPVPTSFNATNIQWNGTDTVSFDTNVDLSSLNNYGDTNYCRGSDPCEIFDVSNSNGYIAILGSAGASNGIDCTSSHCTINGLAGPQDLDNIDNSPNVTLTFYHIACIPDPPYSCNNEDITDTQATVTDWPYTYVPPADYSLSGTVFLDSNHNGVQDNGELGFANATVTVSQNNQTVASTTTDSNGDYSFASLQTGTYSIAVTLPSGDIATTSNPATVDLTANTTENFGIAPSTTTLTPITDSFVQGDSANSNNGASPFLSLTRSGHDRSLIQFSQSQIQAAVGSDPNYTATLKLTLTSNNNEWGSTGRQIDVSRLTQSWVEGNGTWLENGYKGTGSGVTWNCSVDSNISNVSPNCSGSTAWDMTDVSSWPFVSTPTATATITNDETGTVSFNVTSDVQAFLNGTTNDGWIVRKDVETVDGDVQFGSSKSSNSPELIITDN